MLLLLPPLPYATQTATCLPSHQQMHDPNNLMRTSGYVSVQVRLLQPPAMPCWPLHKQAWWWHP